MDSEILYRWRTLTDGERAATLRERKLHRQAWHSPSHRESMDGRYLITAACYEHTPIIGMSAERMSEFESELIAVCRVNSSAIWAWTVLPNHYHVLLHTVDVIGLIASLGQLHGRTSYFWNGADSQRGRKVWHGVAETAMKSDRHFSATLNYIHHNPVKHGYVTRWQDWPYGNAREYLESVGRDEAERIWYEYPVGDYGAGWNW